jgi:hypothetical protein
MRRKIFREIIFGTAIVLSGMSSTSYADESFSFSFGESCEQLFDLIDDELRSLTSSANAENYEKFCVPEWPNTCDDYSAVISQFGQLNAGSSDYFCHFSARK